VSVEEGEGGGCHIGSEGEMNAFSGTYKLESCGWSGWLWGKELYEFTNDDADPLTVELDGTLYRPDRHYKSDLGSVPRTLQFILPKYFAKDRYVKSFLLHDQSYLFGSIWVAVHGGWENRKLTRKQADTMLRDTILCEGGSKANARLIYWGVRMGGFASWKS